MDFLKKNWGLVLCTMIFIILTGFLAYMIFRETGNYKLAKAECEKLDGNFKKMNSTGWKVKCDASNRLENAIIAQGNEEKARSHYEKLRNELYRRYAVTTENLPENDNQAKEELARQLSILRSNVARKKIEWREETGGPGIFFIGLRDKSAPLAPDEYPLIFRQLQIYVKLVNHIISSDIKTVNFLTFPRQLKTEDSGDYTVTPVKLSVESNGAKLQNLVNSLTDDPNLLFFIRSMEFLVPDSQSSDGAYSEIVYRRSQHQNELSANQGGGRRGTPGMNPSRLRAPIGGSSSLKEEDLVAEAPKRQDFLVFNTPVVIRLVLNLDLMEFKNPSAE